MRDAAGIAERKSFTPISNMLDTEAKVFVGLWTYFHKCTIRCTNHVAVAWLQLDCWRAGAQEGMVCLIGNELPYRTGILVLTIETDTVWQAAI